MKDNQISDAEAAAVVEFPGRDYSERRKRFVVVWDRKRSMYTVKLKGRHPGKLPKDLSGGWTDITLAKKDINKWIERRFKWLAQ